MSTTRTPGNDAEPPARPALDDLAFALHLADVADAITLPRFRATDLSVAAKPDSTPVTDADLACEQALREQIAIERPADAVLGEEQGAGDSTEQGRRWVLDPIDGTKSYLRGVPVWATLIALQVDGAGTVGVVSAPAMGRRWWARTGTGAYSTGPEDNRVRRLAVSAVADLDQASVSYASLTGWQARGLLPALLSLLGSVWRTRAYGDFWGHVLVAEGAVDASFEPEVSRWDLAALQVIVTEAGGTFSDLAGVPTAAGGSALSSNTHLHQTVLAALRPGG